jgi:Glyoxalase/Bleomycin resistance protein/Dioxygenase superfamily
MFLNGHYQNAYVTHDLDKAMSLLTERFGLSNYIVFEPSMVLKTPEGEKAATVRAALAWAGGLQFELIEPGSGYQDHYLTFLPDDPADPTPRFHHAAVRRDDLAAMREEIAQLGLSTAFEGSVPGLVFIYLDARSTLGHYLEYVWASPEGWDMIGWPRERPVY